jgi:arsenate reductase
MAEGFLRSVAGDRFEVASAGTAPAGLNPLAVEVMREAGIDISAQHSKHFGEVASLSFDHVITVCDAAREACPRFPGTASVEHWSFEDPAAATGTPDQRRVVFSAVRDRIAERVREFARRWPARG